MIIAFSGESRDFVAQFKKIQSTNQSTDSQDSRKIGANLAQI